MAERRIDRPVNPDLNYGLPPFLTRDAGVNSGFMMAQVTAASLASECKVLSHPASVDTIPPDGNKEDVVPMAMGAAWKLRRIIGNVQHVLAIETSCARRRDLDLRAPLTAGGGAAAGHRLVRELVTPLERDRVLSTDIRALGSAIARGHFLGAGLPATTTLMSALRWCAAGEVQPRGSTISCKGWQQEAALRMLMNTLDPDVARAPR